jgi:hypothetical protein
MHSSLMGKMRQPFIDIDLLYRGAMYGRFECIYMFFFMWCLFLSVLFSWHYCLNMHKCQTEKNAIVYKEIED